MSHYRNPLPSYLPQTLRAAARQIILRRGQSLFNIGEPIKSLYYIAEGEIRLVHFMPNGDEIVLQSVTAGNVLAECSTCLNDYTCMAEATRQSRVLAVPLDLFNRFLAENAVFASAWAYDIATRMRDLYMRYERLKMRTARERVLHYLATQPNSCNGVMLEFSARTWSHELGLSHESLYRTLAALEKEGILIRKGRHLILTTGQNQEEKPKNKSASSSSRRIVGVRVN